MIRLINKKQTKNKTIMIKKYIIDKTIDNYFHIDEDSNTLV